MLFKFKPYQVHCKLEKNSQFSELGPIRTENGPLERIDEIESSKIDLDQDLTRRKQFSLF